MRVLLPILTTVTVCLHPIADPTHLAAGADGSPVIAPIPGDLQRSKVETFDNIPRNDQIDWELDPLGRARVLIPVVVDRSEVTEADIDRLLKHLHDPRRFAMAHVILTRIYSSAHACATVVRDGFDIRYAGLDVQVRYDKSRGVDRKTVSFPDPPDRDTQQANLSYYWNSRIEWYRMRKTSPEMRNSELEGRFYPAWCDNRSYGIKGLTNKRIAWREAGFGSIWPMLLKVHRDEIARNNRKHVPFLMSLLSDDTRFAAAHLALSSILGVDDYCVTPITSAFHVHVNVLQMIVKYDKDGLFRATYPHSSRQRAWVQYRWKAFLEQEEKAESRRNEHSRPVRAPTPE